MSHTLSLSAAWLGACSMEEDASEQVPAAGPLTPGAGRYAASLFSRALDLLCGLCWTQQARSPFVYCCHLLYCASYVKQWPCLQSCKQKWLFVLGSASTCQQPLLRYSSLGCNADTVMLLLRSLW